MPGALSRGGLGRVTQGGPGLCATGSEPHQCELCEDEGPRGRGAGTLPVSLP